MAPEMPGLARVRQHFIDVLQTRQEQIATYAIDAWDGKTAQDIQANLSAAKAILHQIAGSAGSLGFVQLGDKARSCEEAIITYLEGPDADFPVCPSTLIEGMDEFLGQCREILGHLNT